MDKNIDIKKCQIAFLWVNTSMVVWCIPMVLIIFNIIPDGGSLYNYALGIHLVGAVVLFASLGFLASFSQRSWVHFGLMPILVPIVGPLTSYSVIRRVGRQVGWL